MLHRFTSLLKAMNAAMEVIKKEKITYNVGENTLLATSNKHAEGTTKEVTEEIGLWCREAL